MSIITLAHLHTLLVEKLGKEMGDSLTLYIESKNYKTNTYSTREKASKNDFVNLKKDMIKLFVAVFFCFRITDPWTLLKIKFYLNFNLFFYFERDY